MNKDQNQALNLFLELIEILEEEEETDDGRPFHPTVIRSCRAEKTARINEIIKEAKEEIFG